MVATHYEKDAYRKVALIHFSEINLHTLVTTILKKPFGLIIITPDQK